MDAYLHSIESFGTVDGPGVRFVVFLQGCPLRCQYCHNPDTWKIETGKRVSAQEILDQYEKQKMYYRNGGITVTGGEPLLQIDFLLELFQKAKKKNIHTCIDTSGITYRDEDTVYCQKLDLLLSETDLILLDIKHVDDAQHKVITGQGNQQILKFLNYLNQKEKLVWIRHVVVPDLTQDEQALYQMGLFLAPFDCIKALDILPYHSMGKIKYQQMGLVYPLENTSDVSIEEAIEAKKIILQGIKDGRKAQSLLSTP
ncbi:pyruvate formate-lyase-activating enzyme [Clostridia bacterium]|nr:pyruvate formate-lyase-activating enzyme [Clostridia bacterium]